MKDLFNEIDSRIKSPLFGYFIFSFVAFNWEGLFYLFVDTSSVSSRITYFHMGTNFFTLLLYPFSTASIYAIIHPWIHYLLIFIGIKPNELKLSLQVESEHNLLIKKQELENARSELLKSAEKELIDRAKRDIELTEIEDENIRNNLKSELDKLREERDELRNSLNKTTHHNTHTPSAEDEKILEIIALSGGRTREKDVLNQSNYDRVKTEYYLENLMENGYLTKEYDADYQDYLYKLTTQGKRIMVEKGIAK